MQPSLSRYDAPATASGATTGDTAATSTRLQPARRQAQGALRRHPLPPGRRLFRVQGDDEVAELPKAAVHPELVPLAAIEGDRPAAKRHRRRRAALGPHHARGPGARALPGAPGVEDQHAPGPVAGGEDRGPAADRPGTHHDQVRPLGQVSPHAGQRVAQGMQDGVGACPSSAPPRRSGRWPRPRPPRPPRGRPGCRAAYRPATRTQTGRRGLHDRGAARSMARRVGSARIGRVGAVPPKSRHRRGSRASFMCAVASVPRSTSPSG